MRNFDDGHVPIDNNRVENQIHPCAIGRPNWLLAGSLRADDGRLVRVLDARCPSFLGVCLYTASRAQMPLKLRALIDFPKEKRGAR